MNTSDYIKEADRQLTDKKTYLKLDQDPTPTHNKEIEDYLEKMVEEGDITKKVKVILSNNQPKTPHINFLPKIHKNKLPPPGRPIVSGNGCLTEKISAFIDNFLNPLVKERKSYVKDTTDFINKIENWVPKSENYIMGTLDVTSLYTNIPNEEGINSIREILDKERNKTEKPSNETFLELLEMVLKKNNFQFNNEYFLQIGGTAMGTRVAPTYANLFMSNLEEKILKNSPNKPSMWLRYIDDIFFIWGHKEDELNIWLKYLNQFHDDIKFTSEWSYSSINFLDTTVKKSKTGEMYTDLYTKPTDTNSYLKYDSAHPPQMQREPSM